MGTQQQVSRNHVGIWSVIASSWSKVNGVKGPIWGKLVLASLVYLGIALATMIVATLLVTIILIIYSAIPGSSSVVSLQFIRTLSSILSIGFGFLFGGILPLWVTSSFIGKCYLIAVEKARGNSIISTPTTIQRTPIFNYFIVKIIFKLIAAALVIGIAFLIVAISTATGCHSTTCAVTRGVIQLIITLPIGAIPLVLLLTVPFIVDKQYRTLKAVGQSIKHTRRYYFRIFLANLFSIIIFVAINAILTTAFAAPLSLLSHSRNIDAALYITFGVIFFTITSVWLFPYLFMMSAEFYHRIIDNASTNS